MHIVFSYYPLQTALMKLMSLFCLLSLTRSWKRGMEGVTCKKCIFKGSRMGRVQQQPDEQSAKSFAVISTLVTPLLHLSQLQKHRELHYSCFLGDIKRKSCNKNEWKLDLAVKSCGKKGVENQRTWSLFSTNQNYVTTNRSMLSFLCHKMSIIPTKKK